MSLPHRQFAQVLWICLAVIAALGSAQAQEVSVFSDREPDSGLFTSYYFNSGYQAIQYVVCGATQVSEGCFDAGSIGPFGRVGAMVEGYATTIGNVVSRNVYIVDVESGSTQDGVTLSVYRKTDTVTSSFDTTVFTLRKTVTLPLVGGSKAVVSLAANRGLVFVGTNLSQMVAKIQKGSFEVIAAQGSYPVPYGVVSITANDYGFVTVMFGTPTHDQVTQFDQYTPSGEISDGGGGEGLFLLTSVTGLTTASFPTSDLSPALRLGVRPRALQVPTREDLETTASEPGR